MKLERAKLDALTCDPANVRKHDQRNLDAIKGSLQRFGQQHPIIVDGDGIIRAGNGRYMAMRALGWSECDIVRTDLSGSEATAFAIADNRTAELAEWDEDALAQQLAALQMEDEALALATGYDASEIEALALDAKDIAEDEVPDPPATPITKPGDLWLLGEHRLLCGDSTSDGQFGNGCSALVFDPPWDSGIAMPKRSSTLAFCDGQRIADIVGMFGAPAWAFAWDCISSWYTPNRPLRRMKLCLWYGDVQSYNPDGSHYGDAGEPRVVTNSRGSYNFEPDPRGKHLSDVFSAPITKLHSQENHSHGKPVDWIRMLVANCTTGDIYDPFLGSGTTLIAAEQLGRTCYGMEISPAYCDVIVKRWETLTGGKATLG